MQPIGDMSSISDEISIPEFENVEGNLIPEENGTILKHEATSLEGLNKDAESSNLEALTSLGTNVHATEKKNLQVEGLHENDLDPDEIFFMWDKLKEFEKDMELCVTRYTDHNRTVLYCLVCKEKMLDYHVLLLEHIQSFEHCRKLKDMREGKAEHTHVSRRKNDYELANELLEKNAEDEFYCCACEIEIANGNVDIKAHLMELSHSWRKRSVRAQIWQIFLDVIAPAVRCDWYKVYEYYCTLCNVNFGNEFDFALHEKSDEHAKAMERAISRNCSLIYDFCSCCSILWFGKRTEWSHHVQTLKHKNHLAMSSESKAMADYDNFFERLYTLVKCQVIDYSKDLGSDPISAQDARDEIAHDLEKSFHRIFPTGVITRVTGPTLCSIGIRLFQVSLDYGTVKYDGKSNELGRKVVDALQKCPQLWETPVIHERGSVINVTTCRIPSQSKVEILLCNPIATTPSKLFTALCDVCMHLDKLTETIKLIGQSYNVTSGECIEYFHDSVIFFLQYKSLLPKISDLIEFHNQPHFKHDWEMKVNILYYSKKWWENAWLFISEYHEFWAHFDYSVKVACPWIGKTVRKRDFTNPQNLVRKMKFPALGSYVPENGEFYAPYCIQHPFGLMENVTKNVSKPRLNAFRKYCMQVVANVEKSSAREEKARKRCDEVKKPHKMRDPFRQHSEYEDDDL